jgi:hypothetical protein
VNAGATFGNGATGIGTLNNNAGATTTVQNGATLIAGAVTNAGTFQNSGTTTSFSTALSNTGGTFTNNATGTINGGVNVTGGTLTTTGIVNGGLTNSATVNNLAGGIWNGNLLTNSGAVTNQGTWNGTGALFAITNAGTFNLQGNGTINAFGGAGGNAVANTGTFNVAGSGNLVTGTFNNTGGIIDLRSAGATTALNVNGNLLFGGGGTFKGNVDFSTSNANSADKIIVTPTGTPSGNATYAYSQIGGTGVLFAQAKPVITGGGVFTANGLGGNVVNNGLIQYTFTAPGGAGNNAGNNWAWVASTNTSAAIAPLTSILSSIASIDASFHQSASALVASPKSTEPNKLLCGPWSRGSSGYSNVTSTGSTSFGSAPSHIYSTFDGYQVGFDCGLLNFAATGWNVHLGGTGGQIWATSTERLGSSSAINFSVPFYGVYGVATYGSFFTDLTYRHSSYDMQVSNVAAGLQQAPFHGTSEALHGSMGYLQRFGNFFVEPSGALSYTRGTFDTLATFNQTGTQVGQLTFDTLQSLLGRVGVRAGVANQVGDMVFTPFVTGAVWHEFDGDSRGAFVQGPSIAPMSITRVGTFYQTGLGISGQAQVGDVGLVGFIRTDVRFGPDVNGTAVIAGGRVSF